MVPQLWLLWWLSKLWKTEETCLRWKFWKKSQTLNPSHLPSQEMYVTIAILEWLMSTWVYVWQKFRRKNISNWVIVWIKFNVLWLLEVFYSALASSGPQLQRSTRLQELARCFRPRLSPEVQNRAFTKNGSCIQILDTVPFLLIICSKNWGQLIFCFRVSDRARFF